MEPSGASVVARVEEAQRSIDSVINDLAANEADEMHSRESKQTEKRRARRNSKDHLELIEEMMLGEIQDAFKKFDLNDDGFIDATELKAALVEAGRS